MSPTFPFKIQIYIGTFNRYLPVILRYFYLPSSDCLFGFAHRRIVGSIALRYRSISGRDRNATFSVQFWRGIMNTNGARLFFTASRSGHLFDTQIVCTAFL